MRARYLATAAFLGVFVAAALPASPARADDAIELVELRFAERGGQLIIRELGLGSLLFDQAAYNKVKENPLATVVVVRLFVYRASDKKVVDYRLLTVRMVYDLWLEEYDVRLDGPMGRIEGKFKRLDQAYKRITELADIPVANLADISIGPHYYLAMVIELNPVSDETLAEMRRWLARPAGTTSLERGNSFFGSFVSVFINAKLPEADRVVRVRSQPFYRVAR